MELYSLGGGLRVFPDYHLVLADGDFPVSPFIVWRGVRAELRTRRAADGGGVAGVGVGACGDAAVAEAVALLGGVSADLRLVPESMYRRAMADDGELF